MRGVETERRRRFGAEERTRLADAARTVFSPEQSVLAVYLYGSAARGEPARDLDVAVLLERRMAPSALERLAAELQRRGAPGGPEIDLRPLNGAAPRFQRSVLKDAQVLFERDRSARLQQEAQCLSRWADFRPTWQAMRRRMLERWARG